MKKIRAFVNLFVPGTLARAIMLTANFGEGQINLFLISVSYYSFLTYRIKQAGYQQNFVTFPRPRKRGQFLDGIACIL